MIDYFVQRKGIFAFILQINSKWRKFSVPVSVVVENWKKCNTLTVSGFNELFLDLPKCHLKWYDIGELKITNRYSVMNIVINLVGIFL